MGLQCCWKSGLRHGAVRERARLTHSDEEDACEQRLKRCMNECKHMIEVLYAADEGPRAETSCNQLLINFCYDLLTINSLIHMIEEYTDYGYYTCQPATHVWMA